MNCKIATAQYPITFFNSIEDWKSHIEEWVQSAAVENADILLFPEYGAIELTSIFTKEIQQNIHQQLIELQKLHDVFCDFFILLAKKYNTIIVAPSFIFQSGSSFFNRVYVFSNKGNIGYQDKFFMTRYEDETWGIHSGEKIVTVFEADWGKFGIQICYDIEFALGANVLCNAGAELILSPSCTETMRGATRVHVGARARAMENQVYVVVAQVVQDALWAPAVDINFGYAAAYSTPDINFPEDGILTIGTPQAAKWLFVNLDFEKIREVRTNGQVFNFKSHQQLQYKYIHEEVKVIYAKC